MSNKPLALSVHISSLPFSFEQSLGELARAGFKHVDVVGKLERSAAEREALADSGLIVDCVAVGRDLPDGCSLDATGVESRRHAVEIVQQQIADGAQLGARSAYLVPCKTAGALPAFTDSCGTLADYARGRMVQLCLEHFPGSALASAADTLAWLEGEGLRSLNLLLDLGHCLITREDPVRVAETAAGRLGYVHLDDNDGQADLHWPLLTGALAEPALRHFLAYLHDSRNTVSIALELSGKLEQPLKNLTLSKEIVERIWAELK